LGPRRDKAIRRWTGQPKDEFQLFAKYNYNDKVTEEVGGAYIKYRGEEEHI
jgi:hypothetical protein